MQKFPKQIYFRLIVSYVLLLSTNFFSLRADFVLSLSEVSLSLWNRFYELCVLVWLPLSLRLSHAFNVWVYLIPRASCKECSRLVLSFFFRRLSNAKRSFRVERPSGKAYATVSWRWVNLKFCWRIQNKKWLDFDYKNGKFIKKISVEF